MTKAITRADRVRRWFSGQTRFSLAIATVGTAALTALILGSPLYLTFRPLTRADIGTAEEPIRGFLGLTPVERLTAGIASDAQSAIIWVSVVLGVVALAAGVAVYRRMPTRQARNGAVAGAVLGAQAVAYALLYAWFRSGEPEVFARLFLKFDELSGLGGAFVTGAKNTLILALSGEALGVVIGLLLAMFILSKRPSVRAPARAYINFFRGTPLIWQILFFALLMIGGFGILRRNPFAIAIVVLGANAGAYTAEVFRAGIQSIERGQMEAARSLGMSYFQAMRYAILPQAVRRVIPPLTNEFVILIKDTSLIFALGLLASQRELLQIGRDAYAESFNATPYLGTAIGYLIVTLPMIRFVTWLEKRLRSGLVGVGA